LLMPFLMPIIGEVQEPASEVHHDHSHR
jgi:hypothetical protein